MCRKTTQPTRRSVWCYCSVIESPFAEVAPESRCMLSEPEVDSLLNKLCIELGFCLSPESQERIRQNPPETVPKFTDTVFAEEGLDPDSADRHLYRQVRDRVVEAFRASEDPLADP